MYVHAQSKCAPVRVMVRVNVCACVECWPYLCGSHLHSLVNICVVVHVTERVSGWKQITTNEHLKDRIDGILLPLLHPRRTFQRAGKKEKRKAEEKDAAVGGREREYTLNSSGCNLKLQLMFFETQPVVFMCRVYTCA